MARPGLRNHPKFRLLCHLLGEPEPHVWGYLEMMWEVTYERGEADLGDARQVALACGYTGAPEKLVTALIDSKGAQYSHGFIERKRGKSENYRVHDLMDNAPQYVKQRLERELERKASTRRRRRSVPKLTERCETVPNGETPAPRARARPGGRKPPPESQNGQKNNAETPASSVSAEAAQLADAWLSFLRRAPTKHDEVAALGRMFGELLRHGLPAAQILAEIQSEKRLRTEAPWQLERRLLAALEPKGDVDDQAAQAAHDREVLEQMAERRREEERLRGGPADG
jgi:hypothetical protein